jgi:hypothetical protein
MRAKLMHSSRNPAELDSATADELTAREEELEMQYRACPMLQSCSAVHPHEVSIPRQFAELFGKKEEELSAISEEEIGLSVPELERASSPELENPCSSELERAALSEL